MTDQEATMPEPLVTTLEEAMSLLGERTLYLSRYPDGWVVQTGMEIEMARAWPKPSWTEAVSAALGRPVVERDEKAELIEALEKIADMTTYFPTYLKSDPVRVGADMQLERIQELYVFPVLARVRGGQG